MKIGSVDCPRLPRLRRRGHAWYYDHGGKPRCWQPLGSDEAKALARYREIEAAPKPAPCTVDRMLADVIDHLRGRVRPGTLANYQSYRKHLSAVFDPDPEKIDQADILRYLALCPRTSFRGEIALLSQAFALAMTHGRLRFNPCFGVRSGRKGSRRDRLLTEAELDAIVAAAPERVAVAIELAYATGLRIGDLIRLRWADLAGSVQTTKTGVRQAYEPSAALDAILARARALQSRIASLHVLCARGGRPWSGDGLRRRWRNACAAAGVADAHFHDLRAAAASAVERQEGQEAARRFLGHKDIRTTLVYLRDRQPNRVRPLARKAST